MSKLTLTEVPNPETDPDGFVVAVNDNLTAIVTAMENAVWRTGDTMNADLDMDGFSVMNGQVTVVEAEAPPAGGAGGGSGDGYTIDLTPLHEVTITDVGTEDLPTAQILVTFGADGLVYGWRSHIGGIFEDPYVTAGSFPDPLLEIMFHQISGSNTYVGPGDKSFDVWYSSSSDVEFRTLGSTGTDVIRVSVRYNGGTPIAYAEFTFVAINWQ